VEDYEKDRFSGVLGNYRYIREQRAVSSLVEMLPDGASIVDCPCGNGRWWPILTKKAKYIIAFDISKGMLHLAEKRVKESNIKIDLKEGEAENLPLDSNSIDYVFSHALTKHLPVPIQYDVLAEFARISRYGVICSFGIFSHITYEFWRHRHLKESYPVFFEELEWMAAAASLKIKTIRKCTTPIGVEHTVLFDKLA